MKTLITSLLISFALLAEGPPAAKQLTDAQRAKLYKALSEAANAQAVLQATPAAIAAKEKNDAFTAIRTELEKYCGTPLEEKPGAMADCSAPAPTPTPAKAKEPPK